MIINKKHVKNLINIFEGENDYKNKALLVLDYILNYEFDVVSYGKCNLTDSDREEYETLLSYFVYYKSKGFFEDNRFSSSFISSVMCVYIKIYNIICSDKSDIEKINELAFLGVNSAYFKKNYYSLYLLAFCDKRLVEYKNYLDKYYLLLNTIFNFEKDGLLDITRSDKDNGFSESLILDYINGNYICFDDYLNKKNISLETFNYCLNRVKEFNYNVYYDYLRKRKLNDLKEEEMKIKNYNNYLLSNILVSEFGFSKSVADNIINNSIFNIYSYEELVNMFRNIIHFLYNYGFDMKSIRKMIKKYNGLVLKSNNELYNTFKILMEFGFSKKDIISTCINDITIFNLSREDIISKVSILVTFGYTPDEIRNIIKNISILSKISIYSINKRFKIFELYGYNFEQFIEITSLCPRFLIEESDTLNIRLRFYNDYGLDKVFCKSGNYDEFDMDIRIFYARIMYFNRKKVSINKYNINFFLSSSDNFKSSYGISSTELIKLYPLPECYLLVNRITKGRIRH